MIGDFYLISLIYSLAIFFGFLLLRNFASKIIIKFIKRISEKYRFKSIILMVDSLEKPLRTFFTYAGIYCATLVLPLIPEVSIFFYKLFRTCVIISITQCLLNIVTAYSVVLSSNVIKYEDKPPVIKTIFPIMHKAVKVLIVILAVVVIASEFDFKQLNSILAGIGIGGAAIALASQDLIKNFFGGFVVLTDKAFNAGDYISVGSTEGTVEELGFRSTKIRTLEQELVVVPNSKFTDSPVINYSKRKMRRSSFILGIKYNTPSEKMQSIIGKTYKLLNEHPMVKKDSPLVRFDKFGPNSLEILVQYMVLTGSYNLYMDIKNEINFKIMELLEEEGVSVALTSMSVYMENKDT